MQLPLSLLALISVVDAIDRVKLFLWPLDSRFSRFHAELLDNSAIRADVGLCGVSAAVELVRRFERSNFDPTQQDDTAELCQSVLRCFELLKLIVMSNLHRWSVAVSRSNTSTVIALVHHWISNVKRKFHEALMLDSQ